jgi:hypothetical protein
MSPEVAAPPFYCPRATHCFVVAELSAFGAYFVRHPVTGADMLLLYRNGAVDLMRAKDTPRAQPVSLRQYTATPPRSLLALAPAKRQIDIVEIEGTTGRSMLAEVAGGSLSRCTLSRATYDYDGRLLSAEPEIMVQGSDSWRLVDLDGDGTNEIVLMNLLMHQYGDKDALVRFLTEGRVAVDIVTAPSSAGDATQRHSVHQRVEISIPTVAGVDLAAIAAAVRKRTCFARVQEDNRVAFCFLAAPSRLDVLAQGNDGFRRTRSYRLRIVPEGIRAVQTKSRPVRGIACWDENNMELVVP